MRIFYFDDGKDNNDYHLNDPLKQQEYLQELEDFSLDDSFEEIVQKINNYNTNPIIAFGIKVNDGQRNIRFDYGINDNGVFPIYQTNLLADMKVRDIGKLSDLKLTEANSDSNLVFVQAIGTGSSGEFIPWDQIFTIIATIVTASDFVDLANKAFRSFAKREQKKDAVSAFEAYIHQEIPNGIDFRTLLSIIDKKETWRDIELMNSFKLLYHDYNPYLKVLMLSLRYKYDSSSSGWIKEVGEDADKQRAKFMNDPLDYLPEFLKRVENISE